MNLQKENLKFKEISAILTFKIKYIGLHSNSCCLRGLCRNNTINFSVSGVKYRKIYDFEEYNPGPMFVLGIKGAPYETRFASKRENWHIILEGLNIRQCTDISNHAEITLNGKTILCPLILPVPEAHVFGWQNEFRIIKNAMSNPFPENNLRAELGVAGIFRYLLDGATVSACGSPASKLKKLIDSDVKFQKSIKELSMECSYSTDHLRILFLKQYRISPHEYRSRKRIDTAMELMTNTDVLLKEIAWRLGFKNEAAFSSMFKKLTGDSPKKVLHKLRETI